MEADEGAGVPMEVAQSVTHDKSLSLDVVS